MLIAGNDDPMVLDLNRKALTELRCMKRLEIVPDSLDAPRAVEKVVALAQTWFDEHLGPTVERGSDRAMQGRAGRPG